MANDLGTNQFAVILNRQVIENLVISLDRKFFPSLDAIVNAQEARASTDFFYRLILAAGFEDPSEALTNLLLPIPRVLYGTGNPAFDPVPMGASNSETVLNRIARYDAVAAGPVIHTIPAGDPQIQNPCPINFKIDPGNRFTFIRTAYDTDAPPSIEITQFGIVITITGQAFQGDLFSRREAQFNHTHTFELRLRYRIAMTGLSDLNLGPVMFRMTEDPPAPSAGAPPLPANGRVIYAHSLDDEGTRYYLPKYCSPEDEEDGLCARKRLSDQIFEGKLDDVIYEQKDDPEPRYRVEPRSVLQPWRFVLRDLKDDSDAFVAEAVGGRIYLKLSEVEDLSFAVNPLHVGAAPVGEVEVNALKKSLIKIQPTLAQSMTCAAGLAAAPERMSQLELLGPATFDMPLLPRGLVLSSDPEFVTQAVMDEDPAEPGPLGSVRSLQMETSLNAETYFPATEACALSDLSKFEVDFSHGADLAAGFGSDFLRPSLETMAEEALAGMKTQGGVPGLDKDSLKASVDIQSNHYLIKISGEGRKKIKVLPDIKFTFDVALKIRFKAVRTIVTDSTGKPKGRFGCLIPQTVLDHFGLDPLRDAALLEEDRAEMNPLCFLGYDDPDEGRSCFGCPTAIRHAPPAYDDGVHELEPFPPPDKCPEDPPDTERKPKDDTNSHGQHSFLLQPNLKHQWMLAASIPSKDDMDVETKIKPGALIFYGLLAMVLSGIALGILSAIAALVPVIGLGALGVGLVFFTIPILLPFTNLIASRIATNEVWKKLRAENPQTLDTDRNVGAYVGIHLESPGKTPEPFDVQDNAMIQRYHLVIQTATINEGF